MKKIFLLTALVGLFTVSFATESSVEFTDNPVTFDISADVQVEFVPVDCVVFEFTGIIESPTVATIEVVNYTEVGGFDITVNDILSRTNILANSITNFDFERLEPYPTKDSSITNKDNFNLTSTNFNRQITANVGKLI